MPPRKPKDDLPFEEAMTRLEEIVRQLEEGHRSLKESVALFEEGQRLAERCHRELDTAEERIAVLLGRGDGRPDAALDLAPEDDVTEALDEALGDEGEAAPRPPRD